MQIVRTAFWILLAVALLLFSVVNWNPVEVKIWQGLVVETKVPAIVIIAFLLGLLPMWAVYRASRWSQGRKIATLESALALTRQTPAPTPAPADPPTDPAPEASEVTPLAPTP